MTGWNSLFFFGGKFIEMKMIRLFFPVFTFCFVIGSCTEKVDPSDFVAYSVNPDSGLNRSVESKGFFFELIYRPQELMVLREYMKGGISRDSVLSQIEELKENQFYHLRISSRNNSDFLKANLSEENQYYERIAYYTSYAQPDFKLVQGNDTLDCSMYHFERSYGIQPYHTLILGFPNPDKKFRLNRTLLYNDRILGLQSIEIEINSKYLRKIPNLSI